MDESKQQWLSIAAVVLVVGGLGYFLYRQSRLPEDDGIDIEEVVAEERANELIEQMNVEIPENADRATLRDVSGGSSAGVATKEGEGEVKSYSLLASLPELSEGEFYEGYLVSEEGGDQYLGRLRSAKGGWLLEYEGEVSDEGARVVITREKVDDRQPEVRMLEGEF